MNKKLAYDVSKFPEEIREKIDSIKKELFLSLNGIEGDTLLEPIATRNNSPGEVEYANENNASIILGRDRINTKDSGYGGRGDTQCGAIDLVVGLGANRDLFDQNGNKIAIDPNFEKDPARIYISQKSNVDEAFGLVDGTYGSATTKSSVSVKADNVRIISRESTKIVAGIDEFNSQGSERRGNYGVDIIANNDDSDLQFIPKGENLVESLRAVIKHVDDLSGILETFVRNQMMINSVLMGHIHTSASGPTSPSIELAATIIPANSEIASKSYSSLIAHKLNSAIIKLNYLTKLGSRYINSKFNKVN